MCAGESTPVRGRNDVVGAGYAGGECGGDRRRRPTGLMLAGELALAGVDVVIVERRANQELEGSRAGGLHSRTIEVLDQRGIAERFLSARAACRSGFAVIPLDISDFPTRHNYGLALWQSHFERILAGWVGELGGADPSRARGDGLRAGRHRRRRRAVRRHVAPGGVPRRVRRRTQPDPQGGRHRVPRVGSDDQLADRRGRDERGAGDRHPPRGRRHRSRQPGAGRRAVPGRADGTRVDHTASPPWRSSRGARRRLRDGLRGAQPHLDLPVHRHDAAGGVLPGGTGAARRRRRTRASAARRTGTQHRRAGCREPRMEAGPGGQRDITGEPPGHLPRRAAPGRCPGAAQHHGADRAHPPRRPSPRPSARP